MDHDAFDRFARVLGATGSRRAALAAVAGAALAGATAAAKDGKRARTRGRANGRDRRRGGRVHVQQVPANCFSTGNCTPGPGKNLSKCNYSGSATLAGKNLKGANLTNASLFQADASGADLRAANLGKACLTNADLSGATINSSTNFSTAIFCGTIMPDGSINDRDCTRPTRCCETCTPIDDACTDDSAPCCDGGQCVEGTCVPPCLKDADCGPCRSCEEGVCVAVANRSFACNGSALVADGGFLCTADSMVGVGVCVDGECDCGPGVYRPATNQCDCTQQDRQDCVVNNQCCLIEDVCVDPIGNTFGDVRCVLCN